MTRRRDTELLRQIGSRVRELRISRGLTQEEAANRSGFQSQTLSRVETAATSADLTTLARLADVLG